MLKTASQAETITFDNPQSAAALFGPLNAHLMLLAQKSDANISSCGATLHVFHEDNMVQQNILRTIAHCYEVIQNGEYITAEGMLDTYTTLCQSSSTDLSKVLDAGATLTTPRKTITARNLSQRSYLDLIREKELIFATGPAGTGKTYIAVAAAISMLQSRRVKRIILARPAVEAGEKLGFLPGDMEEKVNPYLRPLYDALTDMLGTAQLVAKQESGQIEIAPLAFMRGRTLNDAFLILDEAQNTTREQMKMFLTRLGYGSRAIITGDLTQIDLAPVHHTMLQHGEKRGETRSGLIHAINILKNVPAIGFLHFDKNDVVRHPLVRSIVESYEDFENKVLRSNEAN